MWPGVGMAIGLPGRLAAMSSVSACVVGMPSRIIAPLREIATDHFSHCGRQMRVARSIGDTCSRYSRLAVPDLRSVAIHRRAMGFREPNGRTEVIDVGVRQQYRA